MEDWEQTLGVIGPYASAEEFEGLCNALGDRLLDAGRVEDATLCYVSAGNVDKAVAYWVQEAHNAAPFLGWPAALQELVQKSVVFRTGVQRKRAAAGADGADNSRQPEAELLAKYANLCADQGLLEVAQHYANMVGGGWWWFVRLAACAHCLVMAPCTDPCP